MPLARALVAGGLSVIEVTLRTKAAVEAIRAIAAEVPDCVVGAGTITRPSDIALAVAAGAKYLVSPGTPSELAAALADASVPVLPGCATVSEAMSLAARGFKVLKFFPAEASGGVGVAEIRRRAAARREVLSDRRDRRQECRDLSRLPERARGRRLVGRAEGCDRVWRLAPASRSLRARPPRCAAAPHVQPRAAAAPSTGPPPSSRRSPSRPPSSSTFATGRTRFLAILTDDLGLFGLMLPKVLAGCLIGAFVTLLLPRETIARWVG